jgi:hypothetical protein
VVWPLLSVTRRSRHVSTRYFDRLPKPLMIRA